MPYDEEVEARIGKVISRWKNIQARKMFGGVCHLLGGNMFCGVYKDFLILRLGAEESREALKLPAVRPFDITGKPMKGWVMVEKDGFKSDDSLKAWLAKARDFVGSLPSKG
jgi:TfoX/Sxy family transcriptional regulator of competence genes